MGISFLLIDIMYQVSRWHSDKIQFDKCCKKASLSCPGVGRDTSALVTADTHWLLLDTEHLSWPRGLWLHQTICHCLIPRHNKTESQPKYKYECSRKALFKLEVSQSYDRPDQTEQRGCVHCPGVEALIPVTNMFCGHNASNACYNGELQTPTGD